MFAFEAGSLSPLVLSGCLFVFWSLGLETTPSSTCVKLQVESKLSSPNGGGRELYFPPGCSLSFGKLHESIAKASSKS